MIEIDSETQASSHEPSNRVGSVTGTNFVSCSYDKKISARSTGMKFKKQNQNGET